MIGELSVCLLFNVVVGGGKKGREVSTATKKATTGIKANPTAILDQASSLAGLEIFSAGYKIAALAKG